MTWERDKNRGSEGEGKGPPDREQGRRRRRTNFLSGWHRLWHLLEDGWMDG